MKDVSEIQKLTGCKTLQIYDIDLVMSNEISH